jgi:hypothetical protein
MRPDRHASQMTVAPNDQNVHGGEPHVSHPELFANQMLVAVDFSLLAVAGKPDCVFERFQLRKVVEICGDPGAVLAAVDGNQRGKGLPARRNSLPHPLLRS